ncbi:MAG: hypothetical protein COA56_10220 [Dehalococcoidia bacterium]|nr:MAG: hypothetical protein COA56_10220 [Dehalococcoidia bacterium]
MIALGMTHKEFSPEMAATVREAAAEAVVPNWAKKAGGYGSEAVDLYNLRVAPITGLEVQPDGSVIDSGS